MFTVMFLCNGGLSIDLESLAQFLPKPFVDTYVYHDETTILPFNASAY